MLVAVPEPELAIGATVVPDDAVVVEVAAGSVVVVELVPVVGVIAPAVVVVGVVAPVIVELVAVVVGLAVLLSEVVTSVELVGLVIESVVVAALETPGISKSEALLNATAIAKSVYLIFEENFLVVCLKILVVIIRTIPNILDFLDNQSISEKSTHS